MSTETNAAFALECPECEDGYAGDSLVDAAEFAREHCHAVEWRRTAVEEYLPEDLRIELDQPGAGDGETVVRDCKHLVERLEGTTENGAPTPLVYHVAEREGLSRNRVEQELAHLQRSGDVYESSPGFLRTT